MKKLKRKKRFLFLRKFLPGADWGGTEVLLMDWLSAIDYQQCLVTLAVPNGSQNIFLEHLQAKNLPVDIVEYDFLVHSDGWTRFRKMRRFIHQLKPNTVIFIQAWYLEFSFAEVFAAFTMIGRRVFMHENIGPDVLPAKSSRKYLGFIPGLAFWWHKARFAINNKAFFCQKIVFVSRDIQEKFISMWGYPRYLTKVMYHGTDLSKYFPSREDRMAKRAKFNIDDSDIVLIATARLAQQKRLDRLIDAFDKASQDFKNLRLFLAGSGPLERELKKLAESKFSRKKINFLGQVRDVPDLLRMCDIYVLSSDNEGLSLSLMEAMASGLICISTNCPGSSEIIENGVNGFLTEPNSEDLYRGLIQVLNSSAEEKMLISQRARDTVIEKFDVAKNIPKVFRLLGTPYNNNRP